MNRGVALAAGLWLAMLGGCNAFLDPSEVTRGPSTGRLVVPVLSSIDPLDEANPEYSHADDVSPADLEAIRTDYVIGRGDVISVSIFDLVNQGVETIRTAQVSETGMLTLPMLSEPIAAAGLTEAQLQKVIAQKYIDVDLLENAQVSVMVVQQRQWTFNITGSIARPGQYAIPKSDFRLLEALIQAGDTTFPTEHLYVIRKRSSEKPAEGTAAPEPEKPAHPEPSPEPVDLAPSSQGAASLQPILAADAETVDRAPPAPQTPGNDERFGTIEGKSVLIAATQSATQEPAPLGEASQTQPVEQVADAAVQPAYEFGSTLKADEDLRTIRVPLKALKNGDLRYNIVIRPDDLIYVPVPLSGVYYMGGHVGAPGAYNLAGQKMSLMQAIISARGLDPLAIPSRTDIVRQVAGDKRVFVRVDLAQIFAGQQPDIYLKPDDMVLVGTDVYAPFLAALRGAFRITYGFGFLYDRNYAPAQATRFETE